MNGKRVARGWRILCTAVAVIAAGAWLMPMEVRGDPDVPRTIPAPVTISGSGDERREWLIQGAHMSWQAANECARGPVACDRVLRRLNANSWGVVVMEDGSMIAKDEGRAPGRVLMVSAR